MKLSKNFKLEEFVPVSFIAEFGEAIAYWQIDSRLPKAAENIRDFFVFKFGDKTSMLINTKDMQFRGYRPANCTIGAKNSQHRAGRAIDFNIYVNGVVLDSNVVFDMIMGSEFKNRYLTTIEAKEYTKGWTHVDIRGALENKKGIQVVTP